MVPKLMLSAYQYHTLGPTQNGRHFPNDIFKCIVLKENVSISIKTSLKFVPKCSVNNIPSLFQIMARQQAIIWTNDAEFINACMRQSAQMS